MKPFKSTRQMRDAHEAMFGDAGLAAADIVLDLAPRLFAVPIDPLTVRVVFAPFEMGGYDTHAGYNKGHGEQTFILGNRHQCQFCGDELVIKNAAGFRDFICHELTHTRQATLLAENVGVWGWARHPGRGAHRDRGWYAAISEAAPNYLGIAIPESVWPKRYHDDRLTEVEMTHWPESIRDLAEARDPRLGRSARLHRRPGSLRRQQGRSP